MSWLDSILPATRADLKETEKRMNAEIAALRDKIAADSAATKGNLANVAGDIANLNKQIQTLNDKIAAGTPLGADDIAALAAIATASADLVTSTKTLADSVPDVPPAA